MNSLSLKYPAWTVGFALFLTAGSVSAQVILTATERENQKLVTVNLTTNTVTDLHPTPGQPDSLVVDTQGRLIYSEPLSDDVRRFDPVANTDIVVANAAVGISAPQDMILDPTGQILYVSNDLGNKITQTNLTTLVTTPCGAITRPQGLVFDTAGNLYAVAGFGTAASGIYQLNPANCAIIRSNLGIDPANQLDGLTFDPSTGFLFATSSGIGGSNAVFKINPGTLASTFLATVPSPDGIINDNQGTLYVASRIGQVFSVVEGTGAVTGRTIVPTLDDLGIVPAQRPTGSKVFSPKTVAQGGTSTLTVTITNPNANTALTSVGFPDALPTGVVIAAVPNLTNTCSGTVSGATAGSTSFSLTGGTLAGGASCSVSVNVTDNNVPGMQSQNCVTVSSQNGGAATSQSCDTLSVIFGPTFAKSFNPKNVALGGTSTITITVTNPNNTTALTGVGFSDPLPVGVVIAALPNLVNNCGGTVTGATAGSPNFSLSGATLAPSAFCTVTVNVVDNNMPGTVSQNCIPPATTGPACDTITVIRPPTLTKSFTPATIPLGGTTVLSFTVTNPNAAVALAGVAFTDALPTGVAVATTPGVANTCGGTVNGATAGSTNFSLSGVNLAAGATCTLSLNVTGTTQGAQTNTTGPVTSTNGGNGPPATAVLTVIGPPAITKAFGQPSIALGGSTTLSFTLTNSNTTTALTGVAFSDTLPGIIAIATPNGLAGSCGGGTITAPAGGTTVSLTGATLPASGTCTFSVNVTGTTLGGPSTNTTSAVTSPNGGTGNTATAPIAVTPPPPPALIKSFNPNTVLLNGSSVLSFTLTNQSSTAAVTGVGFTDSLPGGVTIATPTGLPNGTCGAVTTTLPGTIGITGVTLAPSGTCTFFVNVTGITLGQQINTTSAVNSSFGPGAPATAILTVAPQTQVTDAYQIQYIPNLNVGDGVINITNAGTLGADPFGPFSGTTGRICVNVYTFSPDEQEISCCSCLVTPNALVHLSARNDLVQNTLTSVVPNSIVVKLLATIPLSSSGAGGTNAGPFTGSTCNAASPFDNTNLAPGMRAWATKLHALPAPAGGFGVTEQRFEAEPLSPGELAKLTTLCRFIVGNGSGAGVCKSCTLGGLGAGKQ